MQSPSFEREYCLKFLGGIGNVFTAEQVQNCIQLGEEYDTNKIPVSQYTLKSCGVDFGFSSSSTAIVTLEHIKTDTNKNILRVVDSILIDKGDPNKIVELCWNIYKRYNYMNVFFFCDGSNRALINLLKIRWQESLVWDNIDYGHNSAIKIRPVNFNSSHKDLLSNLHAIVSKGYLAVPERFKELIISMRTAYAQELSLDKKQTSYDDLLDGLRLALKAYNFE
jgi:hypothetical protein